MALLKTVWGIDIGKCALKALKLRLVGEELRVEAFDVIEHPKILSQPDADHDQLVRNALDQFLARNSVVDSAVVIAAPGQSAFTRFVKLPPVEAKQVPEIVRFEAEQQIPFDINEVIWRWQSFMDPDSPDIEVGIFAMKRTDVANVLDRYTEVGLTVDVVQMAPLALYNFMDYDGQVASDGATLLVDVGADKTDLVVSDGPRIWTRTLQLGGNNFTESLAKAFKLSFAKAEKLKRTAATSKYARQIFQAMRPVFAELVQEIQRSLGYYTSLHRESRFARIIGLGNGFRLPGLQKYLEQNLNLPATRVDTFNKLPTSAAVNAPAFVENVPSFAVAYGLALQGLGLTKIQTNLLPSEIARHRRWAGKRPWFVAAAALVVMAFAIPSWRAYADRGKMDPSDKEQLARVQEVVHWGNELRKKYNASNAIVQSVPQDIKRLVDMFGYRSTWPKIDSILFQAITEIARDQPLYNYRQLERIKAIPRADRKVVVLESVYDLDETAANITGKSKTDLDTLLRNRYGTAGGATPGSPFLPVPSPSPAPGAPVAAPAPGVTGKERVRLLYFKGSTPSRDMDFLNSLKNRLEEISKDDTVVQVVHSVLVSREVVRPAGEALAAGLPAGAPAAGATGALDPLTGESLAEDTKFVLGWVVVIKGDGLPAAASK